MPDVGGGSVAQPRDNAIVIAGVTASGKSTVADRVAAELGWSAYDADGLHTAESVHKMSSGIPLTDDDRWPWLERVADVINSTPTGLVMACSALRRAYRAYLADRVPGLRMCLLQVSPPVVAQRLALRTGHFMDPSLVPSQFAALEPLAPFESGFTVDGDQALEQVVADVIAGLRREGVVT